MTREHTGTIKLKSPGGATKMHNSDLGPPTIKHKTEVSELDMAGM